MIFSRVFDVLLWAIVAAIIVTVFVSGGGVTVALAQIFSGAWIKQLVLLTGQPLKQ